MRTSIFITFHGFSSDAAGLRRGVHLYIHRHTHTEGKQSVIIFISYEYNCNYLNCQCPKSPNTLPTNISGYNMVYNMMNQVYLCFHQLLLSYSRKQSNFHRLCRTDSRVSSTG